MPLGEAGGGGSSVLRVAVCLERRLQEELACRDGPGLLIRECNEMAPINVCVCGGGGLTTSPHGMKPLCEGAGKAAASLYWM